MGLKWRVGNGQSINVFKDQWLPCEGWGRVLSPPLDLDLDLKVADCIDLVLIMNCTAGIQTL